MNDLELVSLEELLAEVTRRSERVGYQVFYIKNDSPYMAEFKQIAHKQVGQELNLPKEPIDTLSIQEGASVLEAVNG